MAQISWRPQMAIDQGGDIDRDHRRLIAIANRFDAIGKTTVSRAEIIGILIELEQYTKEHFAREEAIQLEMDYPYIEAHGFQHRQLERSLSQIIRQFQNEKDLRALHRNTSGLLHDWLIDHILQSDLLMKPYVRALREAKSQATDRSEQQLDLQEEAEEDAVYI